MYWWWKLIGTALFTAAGLYVFGTQVLMVRRFLKFGVRAQARKIAFTQIKDEGFDIDVPIIEFFDQHGKLIRVTFESNAYNKKDEIKIIYDPTNPKDLIPDYWTKHLGWMSGIVFITFAIIMIFNFSSIGE